MRPQGVVIAATGLRAEARIAERSPGVIAVAGGGAEAQLTRLIEAEIAKGASGIISFGIAGAIDPSLRRGMCVVGKAVIDNGRWNPSDERWADRLIAALPDATSGALVGVSKALAEVDAKRALRDATGALAVDMESHVVARLAKAHELPFAVLRVIADTADQRLPPAAVNGLKPDGSPAVGAVIKSLAAEPGQLPDLMRTALAARRAMAELLRCHRLLGPGLGFGLVDLG